MRRRDDAKRHHDNSGDSRDTEALREGQPRAAARGRQLGVGWDRSGPRRSRRIRYRLPRDTPGDEEQAEPLDAEQRAGSSDHRVAQGSGRSGPARSEAGCGRRRGSRPSAADTDARSRRRRRA